MARGGLMILIVAAFVSMMDRSVMPPLVPVIAADLGASVEGVGHSLTVYAVAYAAFQLVWSTLATRWGRIRVLTVSTAFSGLADIGSAAAASVFFAPATSTARARYRVREAPQGDSAD